MKSIIHIPFSLFPKKFDIYAFILISVSYCVFVVHNFIFTEIIFIDSIACFAQ